MDNTSLIHSFIHSDTFIFMIGTYLSLFKVELHSPALAALCRVCGKRLDNQRVSYFCSSHAEGLTRAFRIITPGDSHKIQSQKVLQWLL